MAQGIMEEKWDHTASLMMLQYNCNAKKPKKMVDFHPFRAKKKEHHGKKGQLTGVPLECFKSICKNTENKEVKPDKPGVISIPKEQQHETQLAGTPLEAFKSVCKKGRK